MTFSLYIFLLLLFKNMKQRIRAGIYCEHRKWNFHGEIEDQILLKLDVSIQMTWKLKM